MKKDQDFSVTTNYEENSFEIGEEV